MFTPSANLYDTIYLHRGKNYEEEARQAIDWIRRSKLSDGNALLDVACGTALHLGYFKEHFQAEGLDLDEAMLDEARKKFPEIPFHQGNMIDFDLGRQFDVITCMFSSIGYVKTLENLNKSIGNMSRHLKPGGVIIIEPWFTPETWHPGSIHMTAVDESDLKVTRMNISEVEGRLSLFTFHYLVGTPDGIHYFTERHELGLFTIAECMDAFSDNGLNVSYTESGIFGRGLYIGVKPLDEK